jgi:hypothetical protein
MSGKYTLVIAVEEQEGFLGMNIMGWWHLYIVVLPLTTLSSFSS